MTEIEKIVYRGYTIRIHQDEDAQSPQEYGEDELFLVADHRDFHVKPPEGSTFESVSDDYKKTHHCFGLEAYIHSGVRLALSQEGNFPDRRWDVSQLGAIFASKTEWKTRKQAREAVQRFIESWNDYLSGNVYGFTIDELDESVWGYYGDYEESGMLMEARATIDDKHKYLAKKLKTQIKKGVPLEKRIAIPS